MTAQLFLVSAFAIAMLPGVVGVFLPLIPGVPLMFLVAVLFGLFDRFQHLTGTDLVWLLAIAGLTVLVDHLSGVLAAKYSGASSQAIGAGVIGMFAGLLLLPPFGGILGLFIGVLIVEMKYSRREKAIRAATSTLLGAVAGMFVNFLLSIVFIWLFVALALH